MSPSVMKNNIYTSYGHDTCFGVSKALLLSFLPISASTRKLLGYRELISTAICFPYHEQNYMSKKNVIISYCSKIPVRIQG
jgi:hypothetical protein